MESEVLYSILAVVAVLVLVGLFVFRGARKRLTEKEISAEAPKAPGELPESREPVSIPGSVAVSPPVVVEAKKAEPLQERLQKTRGNLAGKLGKFFGRASSAISKEEWDEIEEALLEGDVGVRTTNDLIERVKARIDPAQSSQVRELFREAGEELFTGLNCGGIDFSTAPKPLVISVVGVNGAGKTTTVGKLASHFKAQGKTVLMGAVDTFRAGAINQLRTWSERSDAQFVTGREGADPGAVAFDSVAAGKAREVDVVLLDTAGRLHTKDNLMDELKKIHRVVKKVIPEAPHETWLVVDGTAGQNSIRQAEEFNAALGLTGVVVTKLDGTAKGGAVLGIASELKLPVRFIGVGESSEDLIPFQPKPFMEAILGEAN